MATFINQANLSYNGNVINSNVVTGELLEDVTATKIAVMPDYVAHDDVTYVISIVNNGATGQVGLTITDNLGAYPFDATTLYPLAYKAGSVRYYINGVLQPAPATVAGPPLVISGISVPASGNATIIYEVDTNQYAPLGVNDSITNTAVVSGIDGDPNSNVEITETIYTEDLANLSISKSICPAVVSEGDSITYTFVIENFGNTPATAADNVVITDTFNPHLLGTPTVVFTYDGNPPVTWTQGNQYNYTAATGVFATVAGSVTVPAATFTQDPVHGNWIVTPGISVLTVTGTV